MGNSLRCCLACVLPCGALDLIRIVHLNGHVEEITRPVTAGEVLQDYPNHVLSKPSSEGVVRRIVILLPESELKRGSIYFLIPSSSLPEKKKISKTPKIVSSEKIRKPKCELPTNHQIVLKPDSDQPITVTVSVSVQTSEKKRSRRNRSSSRSGVWMPHLESITED